MTTLINTKKANNDTKKLIDILDQLSNIDSIEYADIIIKVRESKFISVNVLKLDGKPHKYLIKNS